MPVATKVKGRETVDSVYEKLHNKVRRNLKSQLRNVGLHDFPDNLTLVGLKKEKVLQLYVHVNGHYKLIKKYPFTAFSGKIGPKLKEGDKQIPEGIYTIEYLNPNSAFYLSMKVNYPNAFDKQKGSEDGRTDLGSDIFIHGKDQTIGCIPIGDDAIEELFVLVTHAGRENVNVIISPQDFRQDSAYPEIDHIAWSDELYDYIKEELLKIPL